MNYTYYIGIDCGVKTGLCVWQKPAKFVRQLATLPIHKAMKEVEQWSNFAKGQLFIRVEDARQRKWVPWQKNAKAEMGKREGAGSVKRDAKIWEDFLTDLGVPFEMVAPKNNKTKVTAEYFNKISGFTGKSSNHARDAAFLVIGF